MNEGRQWRWLTVAALIVVTSFAVAVVVVFTVEKLGVFAALVAGVLLSGPIARLVTRPLRPRASPRSRGGAFRRLRFWSLFNAVVLAACAAVVGAAWLGRSLGGDWGIVVGVCIACGASWAFTWVLGARARRSHSESGDD